MKINETILIFAFSILGLCIICGIIKMSTKSDETKERYNNACYILFIVFVVLVGVSQLIHDLNSRETLDIDEKVGLDQTKCPTNDDKGEPICKNGGTAAAKAGGNRKWPIGTKSRLAPCGCNCIGGFSGDTCQVPPLSTPTEYCGLVGGCYTGLSSTKCDKRYTHPLVTAKQTNECWMCEHGFANPDLNKLDANDYCCSSKGHTIAGQLYYSDPNGGGGPCKTMDMPSSIIMPPGNGCDRSDGSTNPCCQCEHGILRYGGEDFCCLKNLWDKDTQTWKHQANCEYPDGVIPEGNPCDSRINAYGTQTVTATTTAAAITDNIIALDSTAGLLVGMTATIGGVETSIVTVTDGDKVEVTDDVTVGDAVAIAFTKRGRWGYPFPCWMCEHGPHGNLATDRRSGYYENVGGVDHCSYKVDLPDKVDPTLAGKKCYTSAGTDWTPRCYNCPYNSHVVDNQNWCCNDFDNCPATDADNLPDKLEIPDNWNVCLGTTPPPPKTPATCTSDKDCPGSYCMNDPSKSLPFKCHPK